MQPVVGHISWAPDYGLRHDAIEAGDSTLVRPAGGRLPYVVMRPASHLVPPVAANDNAVAERPRIVGLMGYGGAGKTEVKKALVEEHGFQGPHIKTPLLEMCSVLLFHMGYGRDERTRMLDGDLKRTTIERLGRSGTEIQQFLGTEFGRDYCYPNIWLDIWLAKVDGILANGGRVVQESVRFANEADSLRARGGIIAEVRRPGVGPLPGGHKSEVLPTTPDVVIENSGSIEDLRTAVAKLVA